METQPTLCNGKVHITLKQERRLKKLAIKYTLISELDELATNPSFPTLEATSLCSELFRFILNCPLFKMRGESLRKQLESLFLRYSFFDTLEQKATKRKTNQHSFLVAIFATILQTSDEKDLSDSEMRKTLLSLGMQADIATMLQPILRDIQNQGCESILEKVKSSDDLCGLDQRYQQLFDLILVGQKSLQINFKDPKFLWKAKLIYHLTPVKAIMAMIKVTSASQLISSMITLFMGKPFGQLSILQRMMQELLEIPKTEKLLKESKKLTSKKIYESISSWINTKYKGQFDPHIEEDEMEEKPCPNKMREILSLVLPEDLLLSVTRTEDVYQLLWLEKRLKDKKIFLQLFGDDHLIDVMKQLVSVLYEPLITLVRPQLPGLMSEVFNLLKHCIHAAEMDVSSQQRLDQYQKELKKFQKSLYVFLHDTIKKDHQHLVLRLANWIFEFYSLGLTKDLNLKQLLHELPFDTQVSVLDEVNKWISFKEMLQEKQLKINKVDQIPIHTSIPNHFVPLFRERLDSQMSV